MDEVRVPLLGEERLEKGLQRGDVDGRGLPDGREVDAEVFVGGDVAHALHLAPWDLRCVHLDVLRDVRGGLADDDEGEANGLDGLLVAREISFLEVGRSARSALPRRGYRRHGAASPYAARTASARIPWRNSGRRPPGVTRSTLQPRNASSRS